MSSPFAGLVIHRRDRRDRGPSSNCRWRSHPPASWPSLTRLLQIGSVIRSMRKRYGPRDKSLYRQAEAPRASEESEKKEGRSRGRRSIAWATVNTQMARQERAAQKTRRRRTRNREKAAKKKQQRKRQEPRRSSEKTAKKEQEGGSRPPKNRQKRRKNRTGSRFRKG